MTRRIRRVRGTYARRERARTRRCLSAGSSAEAFFPRGLVTRLTESGATDARLFPVGSSPRNICPRRTVNVSISPTCLSALAERSARISCLFHASPNISRLLLSPHLRAFRSFSLPDTWLFFSAAVSHHSGFSLNDSSKQITVTALILLFLKRSFEKGRYARRKDLITNITIEFFSRREYINILQY